MRTILPDEETVSTRLDLMGNCGALTRFIFLIVGLLLALIVSFVPPNSRSSTITLKTTSYGESAVITDPVRISNFESFSSFLIINIEPYFFNEIEGMYSFQIASTVGKFDTSGALLGQENKNLSLTIKCSKDKCSPIRVLEESMISFNSIAIELVIDSNLPLQNYYQLKYVTQSPIISMVSYVFINIMTVIAETVMFLIVPRGLKPSHGDHWATFYLGLFVCLVDGPWIILKYQTPRVASQLFDLSPELFHIAFLILMTFFFSARTIELAHTIFSSWIVRGVIGCFSILLIVVQFVVTKLMPLCTLSVYIEESSLKIPIIVISVVFHTGIILLMIFGVFSLQIEKVFVLILSTFAFIVLEVIYIMRLFIRLWISFEAIGASFAADFFYILMANCVTLFFLIVNMPIGKTMNQKIKDENEEEFAETQDQSEL